jgi:hypothetical protein
MTTHGLISDLLDARLELQDDQALEQFRFIDDQHVAATIGTKGGPACGPVLFYRIADDDAVEISDHGGSLWFRWEHVQQKGDVLVVLCAGEAKEFSIARLPLETSS